LGTLVVLGPIGKKPRVDNLKVYGCLAYALTPKAQNDKLEGHSKKCMFTRYDVQSKAYRCFELKIKKFSSPKMWYLMS